MVDGYLYYSPLTHFISQKLEYPHVIIAVSRTLHIHIKVYLNILWGDRGNQ